MSIDTHARAVSGNCKYIAVQVVTGLVHIMSAESNSCVTDKSGAPIAIDFQQNSSVPG